MHLLAYHVNPWLEREAIDLLLLLFGLSFTTLSYEFFLLLDAFLIQSLSIVQQWPRHVWYSAAYNG